MTERQKQDIIESGKEYFRSIIIPNHLKNLKKLQLSSFDINPFLINYLAAFLCGNTEPVSLAKALVYPRILGTSLNTSFGQKIQVFISQLQEVVGGASGIDGIDIEFVDAIDGRRKYCQCKAGPKTITLKDMTNILGNFKNLMKKSEQDRMDLEFDDLVVGVLYGEKNKLATVYNAIGSHYPVLCGSAFWEHLTGDDTFYHRLAKAFGEVVEGDGIDGSALILDKVNEIAEEIKLKGCL